MRSKQTESIPTGNTIMDENLQVISRVSSVEENIAEVEPIVPLGAVFVDPVAKKIILQANVERKKEHTKLKRMKQARKNSF